MTKVAVVILNWNGKHFLEKFLPGVVETTKNQSSDYEVIIADNGSTDGSIEFLEKNFPDLRIIKFDKNYGFAAGYNKALEQIDAEYFVILNSDVEVTEGWITPVIEFMDKDKKIAAVQPKILSYHNKDTFEYAGAAGGYIDKYGFPFCRGRIFDTLEKDKGQYDDITEIFWATGACMFVRAETFKEAGGFDENFFAHMEEIDLCWRWKNAGYKIFYFPKVKIYHVGGGTLPQNSPKKLFLNYRNSMLMLYKNLPKPAFFKIFTRLVIDGLSAAYYLAQFKFSYFAAVCKSHLNFYKFIPKYKNIRKQLVKQNSDKHNEIYQGIIAFDYFIKGKKTFSQLNFNPKNTENGR